MPYKTAVRRTQETQVTMRKGEQMYAEWIWSHFAANRLTKKEFAIHARHLESMCPEAAEYLRFIVQYGARSCYTSSRAMP